MNANSNQLTSYHHKNSTAPMLNIYTLKKQTDFRTRSRFKIYETILKKCHHRIKVAANSFQTDSCTFFVIPSYIVGMPTFDLESCCDFLINQLSKNGFQIVRLANTLLFISWKHIHFDASKEREMDECIHFLTTDCSKNHPHISNDVSNTSNHSNRNPTESNNLNNKESIFRSINDAPSTEKFLMF